MDAPRSAFPAPDPELAALLTETRLRIRQERFEEAKERLAAAKERGGEHPAVLEAEGDLAFAQRRFKQAETLYRKAFAVDPKNAQLEEKFATALVKGLEPEFMTHLVQEDESFWSFRVARPLWAAVTLSAIVPGIGQLYNGDLLKGGVLLFFDLLCMSQSGYQFIRQLNELYHQHRNFPELSMVFNQALHGVNAWYLLLQLALSVYAIVDAALVAKQMQPEKSPEAQLLDMAMTREKKTGKR